MITAVSIRVGVRANGASHMRPSAIVQTMTVATNPVNPMSGSNANSVTNQEVVNQNTLAMTTASSRVLLFQTPNAAVARLVGSIGIDASIPFIPEPPLR
jgi:hypothetical protein